MPLPTPAAIPGAATALVIEHRRPIDFAPFNRARGREAVGLLISSLEGMIAGTNSSQAESYALYPNCATGESTAAAAAFAVWETQGLITSGTIGTVVNGVSLTTPTTGDPYGDAANIKKLVQTSTAFGVQDFVRATNLVASIGFNNSPVAGDTVTVANVTLTGVDARPSQALNENEFDVSSGDKAIMAQAFADCVNRHPTLSQIYRCWSFGTATAQLHPMDNALNAKRDAIVCTGQLYVVLEMQPFLWVCVFAAIPGNHGNLFTIDCVPAVGAGISILNSQNRLMFGNGDATSLAQFNNF